MRGPESVSDSVSLMGPRHAVSTVAPVRALELHVDAHVAQNWSTTPTWHGQCRGTGPNIIPRGPKTHNLKNHLWSQVRISLSSSESLWPLQSWLKAAR